MTSAPRITVAPNGARLQKSDHPAVPISGDELARTARACLAAGADAIHLHVRDDNGRHSLDPDRYREAIGAVKRAAPDMAIQVTTEAAGRYEVADQLHLIATLKPAAASVAVREMARAPNLAARLYATAMDQNTQVQHILYDRSCVDQLRRWYADGTVCASQRDAILVLGQYAPPRAGDPAELPPLLQAATTADLRITVCAFGAGEQNCLIRAHQLGCALRIGFENNRVAPDGTIWSDNAQAVRALRTALVHQGKGCAA